MLVVIARNYEEMSRAAAKLVRDRLLQKPNLVLGLATGSTPLGLYQELTRMRREEGLDFSGVTTFNLDEYLGLGPEHPRSYSFFMRENLFQHVNIEPSHIHIPDGLVEPAEIDEYCALYETEIKHAGGIDLQVLGIGRDGHIGFNEPGSSLGSRTRVKTLTAETIQDNARFFDRGEEVPCYSITMGVGTVMEAREIVLLASGEGKARAVAAAIEAGVTAQVTASVIQLHRRVTVFLDDAAASLLKRKDYYNFASAAERKFEKLKDGGPVLNEDRPR